MSEYTLDIVEATRALEEGRCERIKDEYGVEYCNRHGAIGLYRRESFINLGIHSILGKWRLVGVKPRTEKRTIKYWLVVLEDGTDFICQFEPTMYSQKKNAQQIIPLSHTYTYTFPEETLNPVMGKVLNEFEKDNHG